MRNVGKLSKTQKPVGSSGIVSLSSLDTLVGTRGIISRLDPWNAPRSPTVCDYRVLAYLAASVEAHALLQTHPRPPPVLRQEIERRIGSVFAGSDACSCSMTYLSGY